MSSPQCARERGCETPYSREKVTLEALVLQAIQEFGLWTYPRDLQTQMGSPRSPRVSRISAPPCARKRGGGALGERDEKAAREDPGAWPR
ncbi:hypothetical protein Taro_015563, partial [Colocasia esculenta]|nr:hypothetical protein [Colocasia esculenta]